MPLDGSLSERLPTQFESEKARVATGLLARHATQKGAISLPLRANGDGEAVIELPAAVGKMVIDLLMHIAKGEAVTFIPFGAELTTQQAADILNVSRPFLVKLIENGEIDHHKVGAHRRIKAEVLLAYKQKRDAKRDKALNELTRLGQEIDEE